MDSLARALAVWLALVFVDAVTGFRAYRRLLGVGCKAYCAATGRYDHGRHRDALFYSRAAWLVISALVGGAAGYVTLQALKSGW